MIICLIIFGISGGTDSSFHNHEMEMGEEDFLAEVIPERIIDKANQYMLPSEKAQHKSRLLNLTRIIP